MPLRRTIRRTALAVVIGTGALLPLAMPTVAGAAGLTWTVHGVSPVPRYGVDSQVSGISCPSSKLCVAVTYSGDILTSTTPDAGASGWKVSNVDGDVGFDGVSCPSATLCVAVDQQGDVLTSSDAGSASATWTPTDVGWIGASITCVLKTTFCVAGDYQGDVHTTSDPGGGPSAWSGVDIDNRARHLAVLPVGEPVRRG